MNLDLYKEDLRHSGFSIFTRGETVTGIARYDELPKTTLLDAFLDDDDIQEMTITSANIGFSRTYTKQFRGEKK